jgi:glyoxylase-like metal-dependent hydrolase (beta-lactamase superfamily II)
MAGVSLETAAQAARLSPQQYGELEQNGNCAGRPDFAAVAASVGLHGGRLEKIAGGWLPAEVDLSQWRELRQITSDDDGMAVHCYLVWDEAGRDAALFDTGMAASAIQEHITANQLELRHIFITHGHSDHVAALAELRQQYPRAQLHLGAKDAPPQHRNRPNDCIHVGSLRVTHRETPGHAGDGVTYLIGNWPEDAPYVAVVGDAIFAGSMGRAADGALAKAKVREQILTLPPETLLCPGHGPVTTVAEEKANNPFFA